jgi:hypothetical protein
MAEVKSTLEIALEKANALEVSSQDREHFKREEALSTARSVFRAYTQHPQRLQSLSEAIQNSGKDPTLLRQCLVEVFLESLDPANPSERIWEGLGELGLGDTGTLRRTFKKMIEDDTKARKKGAEKVEILLRDSLSKAGISGTAVEPNIEQSGQWKDVVTNLDQRLSAELGRLRKEIAGAIESHSSSLQ